MRSSSCVKLLACAGPILIAAGCASPARPLPAYVDRSGASDTGYVPAAAYVPATYALADPEAVSAPLPSASGGPTQQYLAPATAVQPLASLKFLTVPRQAWAGLKAEEQESIRQRFRVSIIEDDRYGVIVDNQGADESTAGTTGGAALGAAVGSAVYVDRAFSGNNNYSAVAQLGVGILGAIIGSTLDRPAVTQYRFRYTVKQGDGEIQYFEEVKGGPFRHSVGICLLVPEIEMVSQQLCTLTPELLRSRYASQ